MPLEDVHGYWNAVGISSNDTIHVLLTNMVFWIFWTNYDVVRLQPQKRLDKRYEVMTKKDIALLVRLLEVRCGEE